MTLTYQILTLFSPQVSHRHKFIQVYAGGDGTFLKTASMIRNRHLPVLGVNTDPSRSIGCLCNKRIFYDDRKNQIERMFRYIEQENFEFFYRHRLGFEMNLIDIEGTGAEEQKRFSELALNEIFVAEKDVCKTSQFKLTADGKYLGKFKSSGAIISTGTGSTGWLYSAKRMSPIDIMRVLNKLGAHDEPEEVHQYMAQALTDKTMFRPSYNKMYYFVRETCGQRAVCYGDSHFTPQASGFADEIEFTSELLEGKVNIDGLSNMPLYWN